ncbi:hypothetical protein NQ318_018356 [Aromia moschata]|uniref:Uncharacterized protein n=1 Tax=Aromia moschata TaxID=1265417 RepID=A0AAV8ZF93_9CUCU|nr:hypothetical protein NQ318_018356 [Aromia moschata]
MHIQARRLLCRHYYPEGGWGWVIAVCAVLVHIINHGFQISCSQLVAPAAFKFHVPKTDPAEILTVGIFITYPKRIFLLKLQHGNVMPHNFLTIFINCKLISHIALQFS